MLLFSYPINYISLSSSTSHHLPGLPSTAFSPLSGPPPMCKRARTKRHEMRNGATCPSCDGLSRLAYADDSAVQILSTQTMRRTCAAGPDAALCAPSVPREKRESVGGRDKGGEAPLAESKRGKK